MRYSAQWSWFVRQCLQYGAGLCASTEHVLVECAPNCAARATSSHTLTFNYQRKNTGSVLGELTSTRKLQFCKTPSFQFQGLKIREGVQKCPQKTIQDHLEHFGTIRPICWTELDKTIISEQPAYIRALLEWS